MNIAVCDDEKIVREYIKKLIENYTDNVEVYSFESGCEMLKSELEFDIVFLDIEMKGMSGMETAQRIRERQETAGQRKNIIIFVTAFLEYMEDAFDVNAYHYLVKPIDEKKLLEGLNRAMKEVCISKEQSNRYIIVKNQGIKTKLFLKDILYIESSNKKIIIHTTNSGSETIETYAKMEEMEH